MYNDNTKSYPLPPNFTINNSLTKTHRQSTQSTNPTTQVISPTRSVSPITSRCLGRACLTAHLPSTVALLPRSCWQWWQRTAPTLGRYQRQHKTSAYIPGPPFTTCQAASPTQGEQAFPTQGGSGWQHLVPIAGESVRSSARGPDLPRPAWPRTTCRAALLSVCSGWGCPFASWRDHHTIVLQLERRVNAERLAEIAQRREKEIEE